MKNIYPVFSFARFARPLSEFIGNFKAGLFLLLFIVPLISDARVIYVTESAAGNHDGLSWANAASFYVTFYINANTPSVLRPGDEVWLKTGRYDVTGSSKILLSTSVYGGFIGTETQRSQADPVAHPDTIAGESWRSFSWGNAVNSSMEQGSEINGIYFLDAWIVHDKPAGLYNNCIFDGKNVALAEVDTAYAEFTACTFKNVTSASESPVSLRNHHLVHINNCTFSNNHHTGGGAVHVRLGGKVIIDACQFLNNTSYSSNNNIPNNGLGGAILGDGGSTMIVSNSLFSSNTPNTQDTRTSQGGAIYASGTATISHCVFNNILQVVQSGGAIFAANQSIGEILTVQNCLFTNNKAGNGAAIYTLSNKCVFANNTFVNNNCDVSGGFAMHVNSDSCIIANNIFLMTVSDPNRKAYGKKNLSYQVEINNISNDGSIGGIMKNPILNPDHTLTACSPAVNGGSNLYAAGTTDLANGSRIINGIVDMGCYEFVGNRIPAPGIHSSTPEPVCVGKTITLTASPTGTPASYKWYSGQGDTFSIPSYFIGETTSPSITFNPFDYQYGYKKASYNVVANVGCTNYSATLIMQIGRNIHQPTIDSIRPALGASICPGDTAIVYIKGLDWGRFCGDTAEYSINGGGVWFPYQNKTLIPTQNITGDVYVRARATGCEPTTCTIPWKTLGFWRKSKFPPGLSVSISASQTEVLAGTPVTFTAIASTGGLQANYYWYKNNVIVPGTADNIFSDNNVHEGDIVHCSMVLSGLLCEELVSTTKQSNSITEHIASLVITAPSACLGNTLSANYNGSAAQLMWKQQVAPGYEQPVKTAYAMVDGVPSTLISGIVASGGYFIDAAGNVYFSTSDRVIKATPDNGAYITSLVAGGNGTGTGSNQFGSPGVVRLGADGYLYIGDGAYPQVKKWLPGAPGGAVIAGGLTTGSGDNELGGGVKGFCIDAAGNLFVADALNHRIQKWAPGATDAVTVAGGNGFGSGMDQLSGPTDVTLDAAGVMYIADRNNHRIQRWVQGAAYGGTVAGGIPSGSGMNQLNRPEWVAIDNFQNLYIADQNNHRIQKYALQTGFISTVAALGNISAPIGGISVDASGNLYALDRESASILKYTSLIDSTYTPVDSGSFTVEATGFTGNVSTSSPFYVVELNPEVSIASNFPNGLCQGMMAHYTATAVNGGPNPLFQWYVNASPVGPNSPSPEFNYPATIGDEITCILTSNAECINDPSASSNTIIVEQPGSPQIHIALQNGGTTICENQIASFLATTADNLPGDYHWKKNALDVGIPHMTTYEDPGLNAGDVITCVFTSLLNCVSPHEVVSNGVTVNELSANITAAPDNGCLGESLYESINLPASLAWHIPDGTDQIVPLSWDPNGNTVAEVDGATAVSVNDSGFIYVSSNFSNNIQRSAPNNGTSTIVAGAQGPPFAAGSGSTQFTNPAGIFVDDFGNLYVADPGNHRVQKWLPGATEGVTVAGGNGPGFAANQLAVPAAVFVDGSGNVYVADLANKRIQKWAPGASSGSTVAGVSNQFDSQFPDEFLFGPTALYVDETGTMYIADHSRIIKWEQGAISGQTVAGTFGSLGSGDNQISHASGVWLDWQKNIYVSDAGNHRVQLWIPGSLYGLTIAGGNGPGNNADQLTNPSGVFVDGDGNVFVVDNGNGRIQQFSPHQGLNPATITVPGPYSLTATSFNGCATTTAPYFIDATLVPAISIVSDAIGTICPRSKVTFSAYPFAQGSSPTFLWLKNGSQVGDNSAIYVDSSFNGGDVIRCALFSSSPCVGTPVVISNDIIMSVAPPLSPSVSLTTLSGHTDICSGDPVSFVASPINGGASPVYEFIVNGLSAQKGPSNNYTINLSGNSDVVQCIMTSSDICVSPASDTAEIIITQKALPEITVSADPGDVVCNGTTVSFTATNSDISAPLTFNWYKNINLASTGTPGFQYSTPVEDDEIYCTFLSECGIDVPSNTITISITSAVAPSVSIDITDSLPGVCSGTPVTFTATATNAGNNVQYNFKVNDQSAQNGSSPTFTRSNLSDQDVIICQITTVDYCISPNTALSNSITISIGSAPVVTCPGDESEDAAAGQCGATVTYGMPTASGKPSPEFTYSTSSGSFFAVGINNVIVTATNICGSDNCDFDVTVTDRQQPDITCPRDTGITASQATCTKQLTLSVATATDNCGVSGITNNFNNTSDASGTYPVGPTSVIWTATDLHTLTDVCTQTVTVYPCIQISASVSNTICIGSSNGAIILSSSGGHGAYSYRWSNGPTTANLGNLAAGNYTVTVNDQTLGTATAIFTVGTIVPAAKPAIPGGISGLNSFCQNTTTVYSIAPVAFATSYLWTAPANATILSGQGTTQVTFQFLAAFTNGTLSAQAINCKGTSAKSNLLVAVIAKPDKPVTIFGTASVCANSSQSYSISAVSGATGYTWSLPANCTFISGQGTPAITVQFQPGFSNGNIGVYVSNCAGSSAVKNLGVNIIPFPAKPGAIKGAGGICANITYQYQIDAVNNATSYLWTAPANVSIISGQGTRSITLQCSNTFVSGKINVAATNCSGNSGAESKTIAQLLRGCSTGKTDEASNDETTVEKIAEQAALEFSASVYPNPFTDQFRIVISGASQDPVTIGIYSIDGRLIEEKTQIFTGADIYEGNILADGVYLIKITQNAQTKVLRLIKSR